VLRVIVVMITGSAGCPAHKAGHPADLPVIVFIDTMPL
jgi:hypothetical protein